MCPEDSYSEQGSYICLEILILNRVLTSAQKIIILKRVNTYICSEDFYSEQGSSIFSEESYSDLGSYICSEYFYLYY